MLMCWRKECEMINQLLEVFEFHFSNIVCLFVFFLFTSQFDSFIFGIVGRLQLGFGFDPLCGDLYLVAAFLDPIRRHPSVAVTAWPPRGLPDVSHAHSLADGVAKGDGGQVATNLAIPENGFPS